MRPKQNKTKQTPLFTLHDVEMAELDEVVEFGKRDVDKI